MLKSSEEEMSKAISHALNQKGMSLPVEGRVFNTGIDPYYLDQCKAERNEDKASWQALRASGADFDKQVIEYMYNTKALNEVIDEKLLQEMKDAAKYYMAKVMEKTFTSQKVRLTLQKFNLADHFIDSIIKALETE